MNHKTDTEFAFSKGEQTKIVMEEIEGVMHALIPDHCSLKSMEHLLPAPLRLKSRSTFHDLDSFNAYVQKFKKYDTVIYLDDDTRTFVTVFDHHGPDNPTWGEHTSKLSLELSSEWMRFKSMDGEPMKPMEFAEFIEDNVDYLSADGLDASDLMTLAQDYRINVRS